MNRYRNHSPQRGISRFAAAGLSFVIAFYLMFLMPLPYYIYQPGSAENVRPMVSLKQEQEAYPKKGAFLLTAVGVSNANVVGYLFAKWKQYDIYPKKQILQNGETDKEHSQRQVTQMMGSQSNAIQVAYKKAGVPYAIANEGIMVVQTYKDMPAGNVLQAGDYLTRINDKDVLVGQEILDELKGRAAGEKVEITFNRKGNAIMESIELANLPVDETAKDQAPRVGIGFVFAQIQSVKADDPALQVTVHVDNIGGPSAGLMFALEIYNRLTPDDWTKGYRIAGTGTIDANETIGPIGGIRHKIVAAAREKADYFLAPANNVEEARKQLSSIKTTMKLVPVATMEDALAFIRSLPPKAG